MCGIAGFIGIESREEARSTLQAMVGSLVRRGPDSEGVELWPRAALGHRRLSILDLSEAGRQPMISDDGEIGLVFNGCIYNFLELRRELESHGHRFRSNTDTEVLLRGYDQWGIQAMVPRLRGMFAFAIWDNRKRSLSLVRDRLGVKPLVYAAVNGRIAFASTVTALQAAGLVDEIDPDAVLEFLEFGWVSDDRTIFKGAAKLPAATILEWRDGKISESCYWTPPQAGTLQIPFEEAVERAEALLLESVKLRLIADVPVGALLSGGIDSALVCWATAKLNANLKAFTISTPGDPADESTDATDTARMLGIPHKIIELPPDQQPALDDLTNAYGEPFACPSALAMLRVCKAIKPSATVLLTGDGGDDVFLGYTHHRNLFTAQKLANRLPSFSPRAWSTLRPAISRVPALRRAMHLTDYAIGGLGAVAQVHDGIPYYQNAGMLGDRCTSATLSHRQIPHSFSSAKALMSNFLDYERKTRFVAEYMTKVDGGAMFYAIEARSPFLDHVMWEFAASLPFEQRLQGGELKAVLRALVRKVVSPAVASRRKQGFTVPVGTWLVRNWKPQLDVMRHASRLEQEGWLHPGTLEPAISDAVGRGQAPVQLWSLVVLENWFRQHAIASPLATAS